MSKTQENICFYLHIPKTAGSTFNKHIVKNYKPNEYISVDKEVLDGETSYTPKSKSLIIKYFSNMKKRDLDNIKIVYGHLLPYGIHKYFDKNAFYFTILRNPEKRILSIYNFLATLNENNSDKQLQDRLQEIFLVDGRQPSFHKWYENKFSKKTNDIALLNTAEIMKTLGYDISNFSHIGFTESYKYDSLYLYKKLGFNKFFISQNVSNKKVINPSPKLKKLIYKDNKEAFRLYKLAKKKHNLQNTNMNHMSMKMHLLLPLTQTLYDFPEYAHLWSSYMRKKSETYSRLLDTVKHLLK